jgi:fatty acid desaturase
MSPVAHPTNDYAALKRQIKEAGLLEKQPLHYVGKMLFLFAMLALSVVVLLFVKPFWLQLLNAVFFAFVTTQIGLIGHDAGHRQVFRTTWKNDVMGLITGNLLVGISNEWWLGRHNQHHSHPNQLDLDPDIYIPIIAFSPEDLLSRGPILLRFMKYQAYFFFPVLTLALLSMQIDTVQFLLQPKVKNAAIERVLLSLHYVCYFALLFSHLSIWQAILFILVHKIFAGVYMGSVFAPNHKGMPVLPKNSKLEFWHRQVMTARNVYAHPMTDFWCGGLNYQIEHHLFPAMPRHHLKKAQVIIKAFCLEHSIPYYETNFLHSYWETLHSLHQVTAPLRAAGKLA